MSVGDWIIYYSPRELFDESTPCQRFTAIGQVTGTEVYPFKMAPGFIPHRRDFRFLEACELLIRPLIEKLTFIRDKGRWGYSFRLGHFEIPKADFELIASGMLTNIPEQYWNSIGLTFDITNVKCKGPIL
jgi:hypothetical protein